jgi:hypothetical protein
MNTFNTIMQYLDDTRLEEIRMPDTEDIQRDFHLVRAAIKGEDGDVMQKAAADLLDPTLIPLLKARSRAAELLKQHNGNVADALWAHTQASMETLKIALDVMLRESGKRQAMREGEENFRHMHPHGSGPFANAGEPFKPRRLN